MTEKQIRKGEQEENSKKKKEEEEIRGRSEE